MKFTRGIHLIGLLLVAVVTAAAAPSNPNDPPPGRPANKLPPEIKSFAAAKEKQARALAGKLNLELSPDMWAFFDAAKKGEWDKMVALREKLRKRAGQYEGSTSDPGVATPAWSTVLEIDLAAEEFAVGEPKYAFNFGHEVIKSIPAGGLYFGGTDPGRGLITALSTSHERGDPLFTLTQNALADENYLTYLREMYGARIRLPTPEDCQKAFADYVSDAGQRLKAGQLKPGENVKMVEGRVEVSGQVCVMAINGLLTRWVFEKNPEREFFIEESFPLDWMYPHLAPHGLIMKIHREPLAALSSVTLNQDREYWNRRVKSTLGGWLNPETPVKALCDFAEKVYLRKDLSGFTGDPKFVRNEYPCKLNSKLRSAIGGLYAWRADQAKDPQEKSRMRQAADYAFRQALALCPCSPEVVFRYATLLGQEKRHADALLIAQTAAKLAPENGALKGLVRHLEHLAKSGAQN